MRRQFSVHRNRLDLSDRVQVRVLRKRLKVSDRELTELVRKAGHSIAAVRKEAGLQATLSLPSSRLPQPEVIASTTPLDVEQPRPTIGV